MTAGPYYIPGQGPTIVSYVDCIQLENTDNCRPYSK